jgi:hypothetical protein
MCMCVCVHDGADQIRQAGTPNGRIGYVAGGRKMRMSTSKVVLVVDDVFTIGSEVDVTFSFLSGSV